MTVSEGVVGADGRHAFGRDVLLLFAVLTGANLSNYFFHVVMTRLLGPADYGALGALLGVMLVMSVPVNAVQAVIARRVAEAKSQRERTALLRSGLMLVGGIGAACLTIVASASPWLAGFLHMDSVLPVVLLALTLLPALVAPVGRGVLQGQRRFGVLGGGFAGAAVLRIGLGFLLVGAGWGLTGAVSALALSEAAAAGFALAPLRRWLGVPGRGRAVPLLREAASTAWVLLAFWLLVTLDVILARHYLPPIEAGRYSAAALVGRAVLFLPGAVALVAYPRFVEERDTPAAAATLRKALGIVVGAGAAASIGVVAFPGAIPLLFGSAYAGTGSLAAVLAAAMTAFGACTVLVYHALALGRSPARRLWVAMLAQLGALVAFHDSPMVMAVIVLASACVAAGLLSVGSVRTRRPLPRPRGELWDRADGGIDLSVVTPTYNGQVTIRSSVQALTAALRRAGIRYEVIVVSDGSTDATMDAARSLPDDRVHVLHYEQNEGKGFALRTGLAHACGNVVAFIDSDGDLDPTTLVRFLTLMRMYEADMVIGSKRHPLSDVEYPTSRLVMSWTYHKLVRILFGLRVNDTQTGVKIIRRDLLAEILPRLHEKRFAFDLELIAAARRAGYRRIMEAPVRLRYRFASTVSWRSVLGILHDTAAIWFRFRLTRDYDPTPADVGRHAGPPEEGRPEFAEVPR